VTSVKVFPAAAVDVICVLLFAIIGRSSHAEADNLAGVAHTAWPFLVGCLVGLILSRSWRAPAHLRTGVVVWICTVVIGVGLRLLSGSTAQVPFIIVATITLGVFLVGWRALRRLVLRVRTGRIAKETV
jgi:peptidoglycan/LPS O-acetylase OafA/YrhL